jgi:predicted nucleic acid-binding protein
MPVLVDSNVLIDVITQDPNWSEWSLNLLETYGPEGLLINPSVYAELCADCDSTSEVDSYLRGLGLSYTETPRSGLFLAAKAYRRYRKAGGARRSILPDFYIGGHAEASDFKLISRDKGRFTTYFPKVELICP